MLNKELHQEFEENSHENENVSRSRPRASRRTTERPKVIKFLIDSSKINR